MTFRIRFEDTQLTAPVLDTCNGNTLTIFGQAEGDGSIICGALDNYESEQTIIIVYFKDWPNEGLQVRIWYEQKGIWIQTDGDFML